MRYWGKNIEIDGGFYQTNMGKELIITPALKAHLKATGNYYFYEGDVSAFETVVQNMMREIESNTVGKILIDAINRSSRKLRIIPLTWKEQYRLDKIPCANPVGAYHPQGNACVIWFEPWSRMKNLFTGGNSPYQVLVHELQHGLRQIRGKYYNTGPVGGFPNAEELFSVTIENMYLSAAGQPQRMIGAYNANVALGGRSAASWHSEYDGPIDVWCEQLGDVAGPLQTLNSIWNPIWLRSIFLTR